MFYFRIFCVFFLAVLNGSSFVIPEKRQQNSMMFFQGDIVGIRKRVIIHDDNYTKLLVFLAQNFIFIFSKSNKNPINLTAVLQEREIWPEGIVPFEIEKSHFSK
jgi:hypothetical protein